MAEQDQEGNAKLQPSGDVREGTETHMFLLFVGPNQL